MVKKELRIIPILDNENKVIKVLDLFDKKLSQNYSLVINKNIQVVIMAGGIGKNAAIYACYSKTIITNPKNP